MHSVIITGFICLLICTNPSNSQRVQGRYLPPPSQDRPCTSAGRCGEDLEKPITDTHRGGYNVPSKPERRPPDSGQRPKSESGSIRYDGGHYDEKPISVEIDRPKHKEYDYEDTDRPKVSSSRDEYRSKPSSTGDYAPKPVIRDDYAPKPTIRDDYVPKPPVRDDYGPKPGIDDYAPKPSVRDEYVPRPAVRDDYASKPAVRDDYASKPAVRDDYVPKPAVRDDYVPKPAVRDDYVPKPAVRDDYVPKPAVRDDYVPKPAVRDDYVPKPAVRDDYVPKPAVRDDYVPKPSVRDDYAAKPATRDDFNPNVNAKPPVRQDYATRPVYKEDSPPKRVSGPYGQPVRPSGDYDKGRPSYPGDRDRKPGGSDFDVAKDYNEKPADDLKELGTGGRPAATKDDGNCICVPYYQCRDGHIVTDGAGIIDARRRPQPDEELPLDGKFNPPSCGPFHVCCNTPETSTVKPYEHRCGVRNPSGINSRILSPSNAGEADFGEWPWQAAVLKTEGTVNIFQCGGVLIDKYHIITVAHCVFHLYKYDDYPLKVRLGEWDTQTTSEFLAHEDYKVSKIIIHPEYRNTSLWNDIAILRLQEPVLFAPHIDTVCLPKYDEIFSGQNCVVTGWGKDSYKGGTFSNVMKEVALQVIDNYRCEEMLRKTRLGRFFQLHEGFVCAGGEHGLDSCKGDGGGPLVCYRKDRSYALAGLVSWGIDCGQPGVPGVYVKVQKYLDWISKSTGVNLEEYWPKA